MGQSPHREKYYDKNDIDKRDRGLEKIIVIAREELSDFIDKRAKTEAAQH
jgi:hypothetical protein